MTDKKKPMRVKDDPQVAEIFSSKLVGSVFDGGVIVITLGCMRFVPEKTDTAPGPTDYPLIFVNNRIALSPAAAIELVNNLNNLLATLSNMPGSNISVAGAPDPKKAN